MRKYRKKSIGRQVAHEVFDQFGPLWEIKETKENGSAQAFWENVIGEYTEGDFKNYPSGLGDWVGPIQTFKSKQKS